MNKKISLIGAIVVGAFLTGVAQSAPEGAAPPSGDKPAQAASSSTSAPPTPIEVGEKIYKRERCETCHGGDLKGSAAFPNLLTSPKTADKAAFSQIVLEGKGAMPSFKANEKVSKGIEELYAFVSSKRAAAPK